MLISKKKTLNHNSGHIATPVTTLPLPPPGPLCIWFYEVFLYHTYAAYASRP